MARATSVRPAPISPAKPRISPRLRVKLTSRIAAPRLRCRASSTTSSLAIFRDFGRRFVDGAPDHAVDDLVAGRLGHRAGVDVAPVAHHGDAVGDQRQLFQPVRDVDDADAAVAELADDAEQFLDLRLGERGGRLIHDEHFGVERQRLGDLDHLLLGDGEIGDLDGGVEVQVHRSNSASAWRLIWVSSSQKRTPRAARGR